MSSLMLLSVSMRHEDRQKTNTSVLYLFISFRKNKNIYKKQFLIRDELLWSYSPTMRAFSLLNEFITDLKAPIWEYQMSCSQ